MLEKHFEKLYSSGADSKYRVVFLELMFGLSYVE